MSCLCSNVHNYIYTYVCVVCVYKRTYLVAKESWTSVGLDPDTGQLVGMDVAILDDTLSQEKLILESMHMLQIEA